LALVSKFTIDIRIVDKNLEYGTGLFIEKKIKKNNNLNMETKDKNKK